MNVLLVEDNEGDIELTEVAFKRGKIPCNLSVSHNGIEALEHLAQQGMPGAAARPDLILLDLNMPRMGGRKFLEIIKQDEKLKSIPVIVLTSSDAPADIADCYDRHANCYILKPFSLEQFVEMVAQVQEFWHNLVRLPYPKAA